MIKILYKRLKASWLNLKIHNFLKSLTVQTKLTKNFYIRNIVLAAGRQNFYTKDMSTYEKDAIKFNEELR